MPFSNQQNNIILPQPFNALQVPVGGGTGANTTVNSVAIPCASVDKLSWTANFSLSGGPPSGTLKIQVTNELPDPVTGNAAPGTLGNGGTGWVDLPGSAQAIGTGGNFFGNASLLGAAWCRVTYVSNIGNPIVTIWLNGK